jgi:hypothetical protein
MSGPTATHQLPHLKLSATILVRYAGGLGLDTDLIIIRCRLPVGSSSMIVGVRKSTKSLTGRPFY